MKSLPEGEEKKLLQRALRSKIVTGSIDVNIMTKLDTVPVFKGKNSMLCILKQLPRYGVTQKVNSLPR